MGLVLGLFTKALISQMVVAATLSLTLLPGSDISLQNCSRDSGRDPKLGTPGIGVSSGTHRPAPFD